MSFRLILENVVKEPKSERPIEIRLELSAALQQPKNPRKNIFKKKS